MDIPNYKGYQVSNLGNIKSTPRVIMKKNGRKQTILECVLKPKIDTNGYYSVSICGKSPQVHQLVAIAFLGHKPCGAKFVIDHINNEKLDNRFINLQITTTRHNSSKDRKGSSKYIGVSFHKLRKKWTSRIHINGKRVHLGYYMNELDASNAYQNKLNQLK